jgi:NAD-dependent deacetylase
MNLSPVRRRGTNLAPPLRDGAELCGGTPSRGHRALASLYKAGKIPAIVTQNIDNLHQASGFSSEHVVELHGNTTYARCIGCGARYEIAWVRERFEPEGIAPACTACDEPVKSATISFGQSMPEEKCAARRNSRSTATCSLRLDHRLWCGPQPAFR